MRTASTVAPVVITSSTTMILLATKLASWGGNRQSAGDILPPLRC
jgi:hypothetical protein